MPRQVGPDEGPGVIPCHIRLQHLRSALREPDEFGAEVVPHGPVEVRGVAGLVDASPDRRREQVGESLDGSLLMFCRDRDELRLARDKGMQGSSSIQMKP